jgi:hypothetical protein
VHGNWFGNIEEWGLAETSAFVFDLNLRQEIETTTLNEDSNLFLEISNFFTISALVRR